MVKKLESELSHNHFHLFGISFCLGWCSFSLKLVSLNKIINELTLDVYPFLMLALGLIIFGILKLYRKIVYRSSETFYKVSFTLGLIVFLIVKSGLDKSLPIEDPRVTSCLMFLLSIVSVLGIEMSCRDLYTKKGSLLKNPNLSGQLNFVQELGVILAAIGTFFFNEYVSVIPFIGCLYFIAGLSKFVAAPKKDSKAKREKINLRLFPFFPYLVGIFSIMLTLKHLQGFAVILGMIKLNGSHGYSVNNIYPVISLLQAGLILLITLPSLFLIKENISWGRGFKIFFGGQVFSGVMMLIFTGPLSLISYGVLRKVNQHAFLNPSIPILDSSIPEKHRFLIKNYQESWSQLIGYTLLAVITGVSIFTSIGNGFLWTMMILLASSGFYFREKVLKIMNEFQLSYIVNCNIYEAVSAFMSLANRESSQHYRALVNLLAKNPRPIISKAIIYSLGRMGNKDCIPSLLKYYKKTDREDIQQVIIEALLNFESYDIDRFFKDTLHDMINNQIRLGSMRIAVFRSLSKRIKHLAILTLLEELELNKENEKALANTIRLIGDIGIRYKDQLLLSYLPEYLNEKYSRRIRINAILNLYLAKKYTDIAKEHLDIFLTSEDPDDRAAVAFVAGELKLKGLISYILSNSKNCQHQNSTLLISLMKLGHTKAAQWFLEFLLQANEEKVLIALNQLNLIEDKKIRYEVYSELIYNYPEQIQFFIDSIRKTKRNFDDDRKIIHYEAKKIGYDITETDKSFSAISTQDIVIKKSA